MLAKMENGRGLTHSNSHDTDSKDGKDKEDLEMDEGHEAEEEDEDDSAPLDFTKPGRDLRNYATDLAV